MLRYLKFLFVAAAGATTQNSVSSNQKCTVPTKAEFTETLVTEYCTMSGVYATNKPNTFPMGMLNGENTALSCLENEETCEKQEEEWQAFIKDKTRKQKNRELEKFRDKTDKEFKDYPKNLQARVKKLVSKSQLSFSSAQADAINALFNQLVHFKLLSLTSQIIKDRMMGNCGEQAFYAGINLFRQAQRNGLKLDIKLVKVSSNFTTNVIKDHAFLLLNSDAQVVKIVNDLNKTKAYLKALKQSPNSGKICDPWQSRKGMFLFSQDTSNLYDHHAGWINIEVQELKKVKLEEMLKNTNLFPIPIQNLFCEELASIELSEDLGGTCEQIETNYKKMMNKR